MNPREALIEGVKVLDPFMSENGFSFSLIESGQGSGGIYAFGRYISGNRTLELHYRYSLGQVKYVIGDSELYHEDYMKLLRVSGKNHYPGFSEDYIQTFRDLLFDLQNFAYDFIGGSGEEFKRLSEFLRENPRAFKGFKGLNISTDK
jgi:hypothetical protein